MEAQKRGNPGIVKVNSKPLALEGYIRQKGGIHFGLVKIFWAVALALALQ